MRFRVLYTSDQLPPAAQNVLKGAHGGFAVDLRPGKGETYFSLKGAGILQISNDLKTVRLLDTAPEMKDTNLHNTGIWYAQDGNPFLMFPGNEAGAVFTTTIDGKLVHTLRAPEGGTDVGHPVATDYFAGRGNFIPTDVEQLDGMMYMTTGYSNLDYVLTARILATNPFKVQWHDLAFGGRGTGIGQFGTGHGITVPTRHKESGHCRQAKFGDRSVHPLWSVPLDVADALRLLPLRHLSPRKLFSRRFTSRPRSQQRRPDLYSRERSPDLHDHAQGGLGVEEFPTYPQRHPSRIREQIVRDRTSLEPRRLRYPRASYQLITGLEPVW